MQKIITATLLGLIVGSTLAFAPPSLAGAKHAGTGAGKHAGKRMAKMADELGLTDAQKAQIKPILMNAALKVRTVRQNTSLSPEARKAQLKDIRKSTKQQIAAILTPAQKQRLAATRHHRKNGKAGANV